MGNLKWSENVKEPMRRLLPILLLIVSLLTFAGPASACSCAMTDPQGMLEFGPIAFVGTVVDAGASDGMTDRTMVFEVETVLAGEVGAEVEVVTAGNGAACGIEAGAGNRLAVFANDGPGYLTASLCSVTDADAAIAALGPGTPPSAGSPTTEAPFDWQAVWLGGGAVILVAGAWFLTRSR